MGKFREKMTQFMYGRYGQDQLGKVTMYASLILLLITMIVRNNFLYLIGLIGISYTYYRMLSKNIDKRYKENQKYLTWRYKVVCWKDKEKNRVKDLRTHRIFNCPNCKQKIRVPKGKGKICIKCPKCRIEFVKKT